MAAVGAGQLQERRAQLLEYLKIVVTLAGGALGVLLAIFPDKAPADWPRWLLLAAAISAFAALAASVSAVITLTNYTLGEGTLDEPLRNRLKRSIERLTNVSYITLVITGFCFFLFIAAKVLHPPAASGEPGGRPPVVGPPSPGPGSSQSSVPSPSPPAMPPAATMPPPVPPATGASPPRGATTLRPWHFP